MVDASQMQYDVIIIGAGPVGAYTAAKLGEAGVKVCVFEQRKRENIRKELGYVHFDSRMYSKLGLPRPSKDSGVVVGVFDLMWQIPLDETKKFAVPYETDIVRMPGFGQWIISFAEKSPNVAFFFEKAFQSVIVEGSQIIGVKVAGFGDVKGKVIVDCTGRSGVVRNALPTVCGLSPLQARPQRMFTVYMEEWECPANFPQGSNTYVCFKGFANQVAPTRTLVGVSTLLGLEATKQMHEKFVQYHLKDIQHTRISEFYSEVPYDFPPLSLVGDGFVSIGDSAFQNKPFNGEGMASGMEAAQIAVPVIINAVKTNFLSKNDLWKYNFDYFKTIGADFVLIRGAGETLVNFTPEEFNWMYEAGFLGLKDMVETWNYYRVKKGPITLLRTFFKGIQNRSIFNRVLKGLMLGLKLQGLYKKYPKTPEGLPAWEKKFEKSIIPA